MNNKKIVAGLLALTFVFGGTALPNTGVNNNAVIQAGAEEEEFLTYGDYEYTLLEDGTVEIMYYIGEEEDLEIPAEIDGKAVTSIGEYGFQSNRTIRSVVIPDSVTNIGDEAFLNCMFLRRVIIPKSVISIGDNAFMDRDRDTGEYEPLYLSIFCDRDSYAFEYAKANSLKFILTSGDFEYTLLENDTVEITGYIGDDAELEIPAEIDGAAVKGIGDFAFVRSGNLESITLPENLMYIGNSAFYRSGIKNLVIPDSVEFIGEDAFCYCYNLESVTLPKNLEKIEYGTFDTCAQLRSVTLPENLKYIGESAFEYCVELENVVIPDGVKSIDLCAFTNCLKLKSITIPKSVTDIGKNVFSESDFSEYLLKTVYKPLDNLTINCYSGSSAEKYAKANGLKYKLIDEPNCPPPKKMFVKAAVSEEYHQIRLTWKAVKNAEKYGIAVYLAGKWRVWTSDIPADVTVFTSPKNLTPGTEYRIAVGARINGEWNAREAISGSVKVTVK
jgi:hypothetical protein